MTDSERATKEILDSLVVQGDAGAQLTGDEMYSALAIRGADGSLLFTDDVATRIRQIIDKWLC